MKLAARKTKSGALSYTTLSILNTFQCFITSACSNSLTNWVWQRGFRKGIWPCIIFSYPRANEGICALGRVLILEESTTVVVSFLFKKLQNDYSNGNYFRESLRRKRPSIVQTCYKTSYFQMNIVLHHSRKWARDEDLSNFKAFTFSYTMCRM